MESKGRTCKNCTYFNISEATFCGSCGSQLEGDEPNIKEETLQGTVRQIDRPNPLVRIFIIFVLAIVFLFTKSIQTIPSSQIYKDVVFRGDSPYPVDFEKYTIGMDISALQSDYPPPSGELLARSFRVSVSKGVFDYVYYNFNADEDAPKVNGIRFHFRDPDAQSYVLNQARAITVFGQKDERRKLQGKISEWTREGNIRVQIDQTSYEIHKGAQLAK